VSIRIQNRQQIVPAREIGQVSVPKSAAADPVDAFQASTIDPNETGLDVLKAAAEVFKQPVEQSYQTTKDFIAAHPFFHHGLMELPIGGGKHFRNVPFIGPYHVAHGILTSDSVEVAKGREVTRGTWDAA
jgi:hypothetical protein